MQSMFIVIYKRITKRGHIAHEILEYPDGSSMKFGAWDEAYDAGRDLVAKGVHNAISFEARRI